MILIYLYHLLSVVLFPGGDEERDFDIERNTGSMVIARPLDAGRKSNYNLTVQVTDGHQFATTQVIHI